MKESNPEKVWRLRLAWSAVFAANLIAPLIFAWPITDRSGRTGMFVAIGLLWLLGVQGCGKLEGLGFDLIAGGSFVGLSQIFPMLQVVAGLCSLGAGRWLGLVADHRTDSELAGCVVTLLTSGTLMVVAWVAGTIGRAIVFAMSWSPPSKEPGGIPEI